MACVAIEGNGVAASCCAYLLGGVGFPIRMPRQPRPRVPAIVVSLATQTLIGGVFRQADLFNDGRPIDRRIVSWGPGAEPVTLRHAAVVIEEAALIERLEPPVQQARGSQSAEWSIFASRPLPEPAVERHFGLRHAWAAAVDLKTGDTTACWIESLERGWLFLIPGWLIAVGGVPETLLAESRLVADQIRGVRRERAEFPAYPRIADPVCGQGWLACGSAAMGFDPICGDGAGNAVREAILASALIRAAARGEPADRLLAHYRRRLTAGFQRHLELCLEFYRAGNRGAWWEAEIDALERGVAWCAAELAALPAFLYRLDGFDLFPTASVSPR